MEIAVLGGGHGAYAAAADLSEQGHAVRLWRRDGAALEELAAAGAIALTDHGGRREIPISKITASLGQAVDGAGLIVIPLPATAQEELAAKLSPHLRDGQVVFLPPGSFGAFVMGRALRQSGNGADVSFAETGTLPYLARKHGPPSRTADGKTAEGGAADGGALEVTISGRATRLPTGLFPARNGGAAFPVLQQAYPAVEPVSDALDGALMNAGPIIHPPLILMNAGPLEHFEAWDIHNEGTQPSIRRVTDALDNERIAVREALGYGPPHFPLRDHYREEGEEWMYGRRAHGALTESGDWRENIDLKGHRYMTEDVAVGLALLVSVAHWAGVAAPVAGGLLAIASAVTGQDFRATGRTLENLGLAGLTHVQLREILRDGLQVGPNLTTQKQD